MNVAICAASAIPAVGAAVIGVAKSAKAVIKAKKAEKIASLAAEASRMTKNAANTLDAFSDTMKAVSKWGDNPLKLVDGVTTETASKALKALETGGDFAKESQKAVWEMKAVVGADGIRLSTKTDEGASLLKHGMAGTDGVAKSAGKGGKSLKASDLPNRKQALNKAKDRAGIPRSQQPNRQWRVGDDIYMKGHDTANYKYDPNPGSHGRYYEYSTPHGKRVIAEHTNDGTPHVHVGLPKGDSYIIYDFKTERYKKMNALNGDHHIYYQ